MKNFEFKKVLNVIDKIENTLSNINELREYLKHDDDVHLNEDECEQVIQYLLDTHCINLSYNMELSAPITLYARSKHNSICESICLFEYLLNDPKFLNFYKEKRNKMFAKWELQEALSSHLLLWDGILDSKIFVPIYADLAFNSEFLEAGDLIIQEIAQPWYIISPISYAHYIDSTINHKGIELKNINSSIVDYDAMNYILKVLPTRGIPTNRSLSEGLQNIYKDNLMQEYHAKCPICGIHISQLLIASHIKPFRDCAHLIESTDHSNGILLCKNHDFLFDQGYISFDDTGKIMISSKLTEADYPAMYITPEYHLPKYLMTPRRKQFLKFHRETYFRK